jgi:hypothetical protein
MISVYDLFVKTLTKENLGKILLFLRGYNRFLVFYFKFISRLRNPPLAKPSAKRKKKG